MALYSAMMLIKLQVPGSFRLFPEATGGRAGGAKGCLRVRESPSASHRLSHEPDRLLSPSLSFALSPPLCPPLSPPLCLSLFPCLFPPFLHSAISFPELLICTKWVNLFASVLGRESDMRLGISVCECVQVTLCTCVSAHMSVPACAHVCEYMRVCRCMCQTQGPFFSNQALSASF